MNALTRRVQYDVFDDGAMDISHIHTAVAVAAINSIWLLKNYNILFGAASESFRKWRRVIDYALTFVSYRTSMLRLEYIKLNLPFPHSEVVGLQILPCYY